MACSFCLFTLAALLLSSSHAHLIRKNVDTLSDEEILSLQTSLRDVSRDKTDKGYATIASYHGYPSQCMHDNKEVACCQHGMPTFPQWHRLYVVQMEQALKEKGVITGIPYWDWTQPMDKLPELVSNRIFIDSDGNRARRNAWYQGKFQVNGRTQHTARAVDNRLFQKVEPGQHTDLFEQVLHAFEYHNYCQSELQFEIAHNTIHFLVGGRNTYSMSHLEYTSYDPLFFLHHSNSDRMYAVYQELQKARGYTSEAECNGECELCDLHAFNTPMEPFMWDSNPIEVTRLHATPLQTKDAAAFGYKYADLTLNGYSVEEIKEMLKERRRHDRVFANFRLSGIGTSADVRVTVCVPEIDKYSYIHCEFAGDFFILGGPTEMPWSFSRPYHFEITKAVLTLGVPLTGDYQVHVEVFSVNGTRLPSDVIPHPYVVFRPAEGKVDTPIPHNPDNHEHEFHEGVAVRKDIDRLTEEEMYELRQALQKFQNDHSVDGYQATAEFHGDPGKCPYPSSNNRMACCIHGMPTFPHWHRLFVVQVEDAMRRRGSHMGIPYWDWTKPGTVIPRLAAEATYLDPHDGTVHTNPFYQVEVAFLNRSDAVTSRDVDSGLTQTPEWGDHTDLFDAYLLVLEQDNFCDFEVQFEVAHNSIHGLVGGNTPYGMSSLSYSAFDPIFYLHHSNMDRIWAIWTALQELRGKPYKAHCAQSFVHQPLKPFSFASPLNNNEKTSEHSVPNDVYNFEDELSYAYDTLQFGGMGIQELENYINVNLKGKNRVLGGVMLHGIGKSAKGTLYVNSGDTKLEAGHFSLLGGPSEMPWRFDREYRMDITKTLEEHGLTWQSDIDLSIEMQEFDGTAVSASVFPKPKLIFKPKTESSSHKHDGVKIRKNLNQLTAEETLSLRRALANLQADSSAGGYQNLGRYHGTPNWCPAPDADHKVACCLHGMAVFPHWHRLLTVQAEDALCSHGYHDGLPYWDWTRPMTSLPELVNSPKYQDPSSGEEMDNPFFSVHIDDADQDTTRAPRDDLFETPAFGDYNAMAKQVMLAFEQDDFCSFEVQYEMAHNFIHALVGGTEPFSMASLEYTAFDPIFYLHHSNVDRLWAIWQALQKYRGKPYNTANCAIGQMRKPMSPFSLTSDINPNANTREHSLPFQVFDYRTNFHYDYDNLEFNGLTIPQLARTLEHKKSQDRVFAGFMLHGIQKSSLVTFKICTSDTECSEKAGEFYVLGSENEMPWSYDRLYRFEITDQLKGMGLTCSDRFTIEYEVIDLGGNDLGHPFPQPTVLHELGTSHVYGQEYRKPVTTASHVRSNLYSLSDGEVESLRAAFLAIQKDKTYENIAKFHGRPGLCEHDGRTIACCQHGMATFPAWHRLYVEQVEEALLAGGSSVSIPYWDWTRPITKLPALINQATYFNSRVNNFEPNPFFSGSIAGLDAVTSRDPQPELFNNDYFYEGTLFALEQTNFCDFEIQFEIVHNALHSWLGGRAEYSLSSLDYAAFDPVFFLHHTNTDRIWAIWQELQRYRGLPYNEADCAINLMRKPLKPFSDDDTNHGEMTHRYSRPADTFDYRNHFGYEYDTLEFNDMSIPQLDNLLHQRQETGRIFAGFLLHNIGLSADVDIYICVPSGTKGKQDCAHKAGVFSVLGGELEMPYSFDRLYKHDITKTIKDLGLKLNNAANFHLKISLMAVNGSFLEPSLLPKPTVFFEPGTVERQEPDGTESSYMVRKNVNAMTLQEKITLIKALIAVKEDSSADGFQSIASFHALPPLCPSPTASERYACCQHGMATFPMWHRLYTVQLEDALRRHGSLVGLPYWEWQQVNENVPLYLTAKSVTDPSTHTEIVDAWSESHIDFENVELERELVLDNLFAGGPQGYDSMLYNHSLLALEQDNWCDFEIQLEITHNFVHSWVGGSKLYSMSHLHYASYDPLFYIHHSNTDRIWAIWQELQKHRGYNPNEANCALEHMREPMKPFSFGFPYNLNPKTKEYSTPEATFEYQEHFGYRYDNLEFVGETVSQLDARIKDRQSRNRVFAGFLLEGFGSSGTVTFKIVGKSDDVIHEGGTFSVLGGSAEMPWKFDRIYKYEITDQLSAANLHFDDDYYFTVEVIDRTGVPLTHVTIPEPSVVYVPAKRHHHLNDVTPNKIRRDVTNLSERDLHSLKAALRDLQQDTSKDGWANLASFHGAPARCDGENGEKMACCIHGMPQFPHWHRLFTLQVEQALQRHGSSVAIPYWDWTKPITELPSVFTVEHFYDVWKDEVVPNPFARGYVPSEKAYTVRDVRPEIHHMCADGTHSAIFDFVLSALEQTDYCDFEVQFEVMHNAIHYLVGGLQTYSLSSLEYSAYDPLFFIHHSFCDKIWAVWQELQIRRNLPADKAECALNHMSKPMIPFSFGDLNTNQFTRKHAVPNSVFDYESLGYVYEDLSIGGKDLADLEQLIADKQSQARVFAGFLLRGIKTSGSVLLNICLKNQECTYAGRFNLLGGPTEMPWAFDRLFKLDITQALRKTGLVPEDVFDAAALFTLQVKVYDVEGHALPLKDVMPEPTLMFVPAKGVDEEVHTDPVPSVSVRKDVSSLSVAETKNLRDALRKAQSDSGPNSFEKIASYHGFPARCEHKGRHIACCQHGMASFPQWHRLFVKQFEDALKAQGANIGIPYWDWTKSFSELPSLVTETENNPFHHGITPDGHVTSRTPTAQVFTDPELDKESFLYMQTLLAFEQTDYCDFEVQFEITHNAIHSWVGGLSPYGLSTLEYTAYDPLFMIHHSNVDRQFAIWQALQKFRGLPYNSANCAVQQLRQPMEPFNHKSNPNGATKANARAIDVFDYDKFNYQYDNLNFHGLSISELNDMLGHKKNHDRVFAQFLLHGIEAVADVVFDLCDEDNHCSYAGAFALLGGSIEMPWVYDRLFKYDVTRAFNKLNLRHDDMFHFEVKVTAVNGTELDSNLIHAPSVEFKPGVEGYHKHEAAKTVQPSIKLIRKDVNQLSLDETANLRDALLHLQQDQGPNNFEAIAGFHGYPFKCPANSTDKYACCAHGMAIFPQWHRLHTVQFEQALKEHGALMGIPYWDWTADIHTLPSLFGDNSEFNPFYKYHITSKNEDTVRDIQSELFEPRKIHGFSYLFHLALSALEEDNYCHFEIQYEILHNEVHALIGGTATYGMATLDYSAFDPFFMIHHASLDRVWLIWQELQKLRHKPYNYAPCAGNMMNEPLYPFSYPTVNSDDFTRENSQASKLFDIARLGYQYDKLELNGHGVSELHDVINSLKDQDRLYIGIVLHSVNNTANLSMTLVNSLDSAPAGHLMVLGGGREMPWAYERFVKHDITDVAKQIGISAENPGRVTFSLDSYNNVKHMRGTEITPFLIERPAHAGYDIAILDINRHFLPPKIIMKKGTRVKFIAQGSFSDMETVENLGSYTTFSRCSIPPFSYNAYKLGEVIALKPGEYFFVAKSPILCKAGKKIQITIEED